MTAILILSSIFGFIAGAFQMRGILSHTPITAKWPWQKKGYSLYNFYLQKKWDLFGICLFTELLKPSILYVLFLITTKDTSIAEFVATGCSAGQLISLNTKKQTKLSATPILSIAIALTPIIGILLCSIYAGIFYWRVNKNTAAIATTFLSIVFILLTHIQEGYTPYLLGISSIMLLFWVKEISTANTWFTNN